MKNSKLEQVDNSVAPDEEEKVVELEEEEEEDGAFGN